MRRQPADAFRAWENPRCRNRDDSYAVSDVMMRTNMPPAPLAACHRYVATRCCGHSTPLSTAIAQRESNVPVETYRSIRTLFCAAADYKLDIAKFKLMSAYAELPRKLG